jgi:hypothetical protein
MRGALPSGVAGCLQSPTIFLVNLNGSFLIHRMSPISSVVRASKIVKSTVW